MKLRTSRSDNLNSTLVTYFSVAGSTVRGGCFSWSPPGGIFIFQISGVKGRVWRQRKKRDGVNLND
jgi:hypothetical protein